MGQREVLEPFKRKDCLRILHIRQSGSDIGKFGSWAFGRGDWDNFLDPESQPTEYRQEFLFPNDRMLGWVLGLRGDSDTCRNVSVTVLHDEFRHFADWVFGEDGIASLEMVAYGDFSCQGRFAADCFKLRRGGSIDGQAHSYSFYFPESEVDPDLEELLSRHPGFLEACPTETLLDSGP